MRVFKLVSLVSPLVAFVGCGSITLATDAADAGATAAGPPQHGAHGARDAAAASAPASAASPASPPADPGDCGKMCPSGNGSGPETDKHNSGHPCDKSPCPPDQS
jgi:hypothetical protein